MINPSKAGAGSIPVRQAQDQEEASKEDNARDDAFRIDEPICQQAPDVDSGDDDEQVGNKNEMDKSHGCSRVCSEC